MRTTRMPTAWTRPLQYAVAGWYIFGALWSLSLPFWLVNTLALVIAHTLEFGIYDPSAPPNLPRHTLEATYFLWSWTVVTLAVDLVAIVGALKRWSSFYWVVLFFLAPWALILLDAPIWLAGPDTPSSPVWGRLVFLGFAVVSCALLAWMVIAASRFGPWAMRKPPPM